MPPQKGLLIHMLFSTSVIHLPLFLVTILLWIFTFPRCPLFRKIMGTFDPSRLNYFTLVRTINSRPISFCFLLTYKKHNLFPWLYYVRRLLDVFYMHLNTHRTIQVDYRFKVRSTIWYVWVYQNETLNYWKFVSFALCKSYKWMFFIQYRILGIYTCLLKSNLTN